MCEGSGIITTLSFLGIAFGIAGIVLGSLALVEVRDVSSSALLGGVPNGGSSGESVASGGSLPTLSPALAPVVVRSPTLDEIVARGFLSCGVPDEQTGFAVIEDDVMVGFDADLCRAIAAAIFGESNEHVEFIPIASAADRWRYLTDRTIDVLARVTTHTMERDVNEPSVGVGFEFSTPYLYNGLGFGGLPPYGACADRGEFTGNCSSLLVCVNQGTTHVQVVRDIFPSANVLPVASTNDLYTNLIERNCNAIAEEQTGVAERVVRVAGYTGEYEVGVNQYSKEPLAVVTREGDPFWSDFVFWTIEALMAADEQGLTKSSGDSFIEITSFGPEYRQMFQRAIRDVGNYGEIYARHLESIVPRSDLNTINTGTSGLIYSFPFGSLLTVGRSPILTGTMEAIQKRGHLKCGITTRAGFGEFNRTQLFWSGMDVDFCRALSAAIFDGVDTHVVYTVLPATDRFVALARGQVDVLSRITTFTLERDRAEPTSGSGFSFSPVNFYDGVSFGGRPPFAKCADSVDTAASQCQGLKICVYDGTTTIARARQLFPESVIVPELSFEEVLETFGSGGCNAIAGSSNDIAEGAVRVSGYVGEYEVGSRRHSKDPLALVTREDDPQWTNFVRWIVFATFYAEEQGITQETADRMPRVDLFGGLLRNMFSNAINAVGNYGEIYGRHVESLVPRENGPNSLNTVPAGSQQYPAVF